MTAALPAAALSHSIEDAGTPLLLSSQQLPPVPISAALLEAAAAAGNNTRVTSSPVPVVATAPSAVISASVAIDVSLEDTALHAQPCLVACALRFASTLLRKQQRCLPFTFDAAKRSALQAAVEQRVCDDLKDGGRVSAPSDTTPMTGAPAAQTETATNALCDTDRPLLHSCLTMLLHWPHWMQQQWRAVGSRKIAKNEVSSAVRDQHTIASPRCTQKLFACRRALSNCADLPAARTGCTVRLHSQCCPPTQSTPWICGQPQRQLANLGEWSLCNSSY